MKTFYVVTWIIVAMNVWYEPSPKPVYDKFGRNIAEKEWSIRVSIDTIRKADTFSVKKEADAFAKELKAAALKNDTTWRYFNTDPGKILNVKQGTFKK